ncbi:MAG: (2Fe-2S) ferredoxin domain-containing protein, partial [bacterium]
MKIGSSNELKEYREKIVSSRNLQKTTISICNGAGCLALGAERLSELFESEVKKRNLDIEILKTGCPGFCEKGPLVTIFPQDIFYSKITSD